MSCETEESLLAQVIDLIGAVIGAIVAEFLGGDTGLGYLIIVSNSTINTTMMFAALIVLSALGMLLFALIIVVERVAVPWHFGQ